MVVLWSFTPVHAPLERVFDLSRSVEVHVLGNVHFGEQAVPLAKRGRIRGGRIRGGGMPATGLLGLGDEVTWQARHFGVRQRLTSAITRFDPPHAFQDTMVQGAFAWMQHDHFFRSAPGGVTEMRDVFRFSAPLPMLGWLAERLVLRRYMQALLEERNAVIRRVAESGEWRRYLG